MRLGYFDCFAGASGDMILACLFDVGLEPDVLARGLGALGIGGLEFDVRDVTRKGIRAKSFGFRTGPTGAGVRGGKYGGTFKEIVALVEASTLAESVKAKSIRAFDVLAEAEAGIHNVDKAGIHFHEVGSLDSVVDVVGSFLGMEALGLERVTSSPLALGTGVVECEHGTLPSPAPATVEIARGLPVRGWQVEGEMTTPTGAAILKTAATGFGPVPEMVVAAVGYGAGTRDLAGIPNVMRLIVGESPPGDSSFLEHDRVVLLETNIDDMNPQFFSHIYDDLLAAGALDVWVQSILMKKGRPGFLLSVLAEGRNARALAARVLGLTTTSGVRMRETERLKLPRRVVELPTRFGAIRVKVFALESGTRCVPEYDDCLKAARQRGAAVGEVMEEARRAYHETHDRQM